MARDRKPPTLFDHVRIAVIMVTLSAALTFIIGLALVNGR